MAFEIGSCLRTGLAAFGLAVSLGVSGFSQPSLADAAPTEITEESEITAIFSGKTMYGQLPNGSRWVEYYSENGETAYREGQNTCAGRWHVSGNIACFMYPSYKNGEPNCFNVWRSGDKILFVVAGSDPSMKDDVEVIDRIANGNPEDLLASGGSCR